MSKLSLDKGMYKDSELGDSRVRELSAARAKINVAYWNRYERLISILEKKAEKTFTGQQIIDMINKIDNEFPIIIG